MKIGDMVKLLHSKDITDIGHLDRHYGHHGIVTHIDNSHRQSYADVLFADGLRERVWEAHLEVVDESR